MTNMKLLEIKDLNKTFDNKEILKNINLSIEKGKIIGLLGMLLYFLKMVF